MTDSMHHIVLENNAGAKRYQLKPDLVADIVTRRIDEGYLTVTFRPGHFLDQLVVSHAEDKQALRSYAESLEKICFGGSKGHLPLSPPVTPEREQSVAGVHSAKRKLSLHLTPRQLPSAERSGLKPAQFYTPSVLSSSSSFPPSPQKTATSANYRRLLVAPSDGLTTTPPSRPAVAKRPPLAVLSESRQEVAVKRQRVLYPSLGEMDEMEGFANLGNTCYMNAVLQSLLGLEPFAEDLYNQALVRKVPSKSLYMLLYLLLKSKRAKESFESQRVLLTGIKQIIAQSSAKFSGSRQQDAHELLAQCLDQLKQDTDKIDPPPVDGQCDKGQPSLSPVVRNFECEIMHTITCKGCGKVTQKPEIIYDFALQLPRSVILKPTEQANLQQLFNLYFACEDVEYNCSVCGNKTATLSHQLSKLPRVLIIYLKRYGFNSHASKRIDSIHIPRFISAGPFCVDSVGIPCEFTGPWPRDSIEVPEEKENIVADVQVKVGTRNGTPARTPTNTKSSAAATESAALSPGGVTACEGTGIEGSETVAASSHLSSEASTPTLTPASTPTSPLPQPSLLSHGSASQNGDCDRSGVLRVGDVDRILARVDPLDFPTPSMMDDSLNNLSDVAKKILWSGYPPSGGMVGVAADTDRTVSKEGGGAGGGGGYTKLPTLRRLPYVKRVKRTSSSDSTRAVISEVCDIVDEFDKLCEAIDNDGRVREDPAKSSENTPPVREEHHILRNCTSPTLLENGHSNGCRLNGTPSRMQSNGLSRTGSYVNGHDDAVGHVTNDNGHVTNGNGHVTNHVTNGSGHVTNGSGYMTNNYCHTTNGHSASPMSDSPAGPGVGSSNDSRIHIMDLEEEENELLKRALEESTKSQPAELIRLQELGMSEEDQMKLALELSIQDSSRVEDMELPPTAVTADLPISVTPDQEVQTFRLMSIVNHIGKGSGGGHYITDVNCVRDGTWKSFNDSMVVEMKEEDVRQRRQCTGYIFFYMYKLTYQSVVKHAKAL
ncbi:hypothetical protein EMCRGX_G018483 [Ephydatia muelleri]